MARDAKVFHEASAELELRDPGPIIHWISIEPPRQIDQVRATFEKALNEIDLDVQMPSPVETANTHLT